MKTTAIIPLFLSLFMLGLLNSQAQFIQKPIRTITTKPIQKKESQYVSAKHLYSSSTVAKISKLEHRKANILVELEKNKRQNPQKGKALSNRIPISNPKKEVGKIKLNSKNNSKQTILKLEKVQLRIAKLNRFNNYLLSIPRVPKLPRPIGCDNPSPIVNCKSNTFIKGVIIGDSNLKIHNLKIIDSKGKIVGAGKMGKDQLGRPAMILTIKKFRGQAKMHSTVSIKGGEKFILETPVRGVN